MGDPFLPPNTDLFGDTLRPAPQPAPAPTLASEGDAHNKLQRNVQLALEVHHKLMSTEPETAGDKRLALEAANMSVKAALATDRTALKARQENTMELFMLRVLFSRKRLGYEIAPLDEEKLRTAPRAKLESALGARGLAEYDDLKF
jgi:hypothetical protein